MAFGFNNKDIEKLAKAAIADGWRVEIARGGHVMWFAPDGVSILTSSLTGSHRGWDNHIAGLRRLGLAAAQSKHNKGKGK